MIQWVLLVTAACVTGVKLYQPIQCFEGSQCALGYYCNTAEHFCQKCLRCEDLNREPPKDNNQCIESVSQCGLCMKGLVPDRQDLGLGCVEPESDGLPSVYVVALVLVGLLLFLLVMAALVYVLRHKDTFKILASTRTSVQAPVGGAAPSAPQQQPPQPPPYNLPPYTSYEPVRPSSPPAPYAPQPPYTEESALPLVKRAGSERGAGAAARESAGSQSARVYTNPAYVRNVPPPSYDSAFSDESDHEGPFVPHDEDTMESPWTPAVNGTNGNNNDLNHNGVAAAAAGSASSGVRRPERADLSPPAPPPKLRCLEQDSNNNAGGGGGAGHSGAPPPPPHAPHAPAPSLVINVLNVNSVRKLNDISL